MALGITAGASANSRSQGQQVNRLGGLNVQFKLIEGETKWGQNMALVGNLKPLSEWKADRAPLKMNTSKLLYPSWVSDNVKLLSKQECASLEYKYILIDEKDGQITWETGENHRTDICALFDVYKGTGNVIVIEDEGFNSKNKTPKIYVQENQ